MDLIIVGAGSVGGHIALNLEEYSGDLNLLGFVDDDPKKQGTEIFGYKVLGPVDLLQKRENLAVVIGIAFPKIKIKIIEKLKANKGLSFPTLISRNAWISRGTVIGVGSIVYPGASINYGCDIQDFVVINMNSAIGHNCSIGECTSLAPGVNLGGHTKIGKGVDVGIGAASRQNIIVGDGAVIGGQAMLVENVTADSKIVGVPGRVRLSS
ncbi:NeuD/PglB/VioB family sugar acetyltransferase [Desertivirga arenae]|uniref:NeuD/PglB/VioB family sugar acetyltransferase n=1 Tax=Desertivirga arenae TaxID=2810309 RepID=UPI001A9677F9|nr:NeuD/PglB/VioB family sugar acetyltransferase [Pedobacter sp. SYSU D00823]